MFLKDFLYIIFILFLFNNYFTKGQNSTYINGTSTVIPVITTNTSNVVSCPEGYKQPPLCLECETNYERKNNTCLLIKNQVKPSRSTARSLFLLFLGCLLTTVLIIAMIITFNRVTEQRRRHSSTNPTINTNIRNRFNNILQTIGLNNISKRGRFPFFSISNNNNNNSTGHHRQGGETSRTHLSENQDEALLFDDPYADGGISGGIHGSSANPYKSLTLSVT